MIHHPEHHAKLQRLHLFLLLSLGSQARFALPPELGGATAVAAAPAVTPDQADSLLVAGASGQPELLRVAVGSAGDVMATTWIALDGIDGPVRALAVGADGTVYACTAHNLLRIDVTRR